MKLTYIVLSVTAVLLIIYDIWTAFIHGANSTISWSIYSISQTYPIISFGCGLLCGHLFWRQYNAEGD